MLLLSLWLVSVLCLVTGGNYPTIEKENVTKALNQLGEIRLKEKLNAAMNKSLQLQAEFMASNATCQLALQPLKGSCSMCVREKCWQRVHDLDCAIDDFLNISLQIGLSRIDNKIYHFYSTVLPYFLNENLKKIFGKDIPYFFNHNFYESILHQVPHTPNQKFARMLTRKSSDYYENEQTDENPPSIKKKIGQVLVNHLKEFIKTMMKKYTSEPIQEKVKHILTETIPNALQKSAEAVKNFFKGVFNRKRRSLMRFPSSCEEFSGEDRIDLACSSYLQNCSDCLPKRMKMRKACPNFAIIEKRMQKFTWLVPAILSEGKTFEVLDISTLKNNGEVIMNILIFGRTTELYFPNLDTPLTSEESVDVIVRECLKWFKNHWDVMDA